MKTIELTKGQVAMVDDECYERLSAMTWSASPSRGTYYARHTARINQRNVTVRMHRLILNAPENMQVDHINGNGLDNRRCNLRLCTQAENMRNKRKRSKNKSGFKGVCWHRKIKKWQAAILGNGERRYLGYFVDPADAARAYDKAATELHGAFALLNFPREEE